MLTVLIIYNNFQEVEDVLDPDEALLAEWAQGEPPGAVKPVSNLYLGTVCNCGENWSVNFF